MKVTLTTYPEVQYAQETVSHDHQTFHFFNEDGTPGIAIASAQRFGDELPFLAEAGDILDIQGHWTGHGAFIVNLDDGDYQHPPQGNMPAEALGLQADASKAAARALNLARRTEPCSPERTELVRVAAQLGEIAARSSALGISLCRNETAAA